MKKSQKDLIKNILEATPENDKSTLKKKPKSKRKKVKKEKNQIEEIKLESTAEKKKRPVTGRNQPSIGS